MSIAGFTAGRLLPADPADRLGRVQVSTTTLGASGREGGPLRLGAAELLVRHHAPRHATRTVTNAGGAWGYDSEESAGDTVPDPRLAEPVHVRQRPVEPVAEHQGQPVPPQLRAALQDRLLLRHAVPLRHRAVQQVRPVVEPGPVRRGSAGPGLREHPGPVRGVHRPRQQHPAAVHRHHLLADEQGLAEPAVEPVQQRRRPGRQLLRRPGGEPAACTPSTPWTTARSPWTTSATPPRPACRSKPRCTTWPGPCSTTRPPATSA